MNRDKQIAVLEASLAMLKDKRRPLDGDETKVPTADYVGPARFERERERVFRRSFNIVTLSSAVASPGDFVTTGVLGTPTLIARGDDGQLRAFLNVCRHAGTAAPPSS